MSGNRSAILGAAQPSVAGAEFALPQIGRLIFPELWLGPDEDIRGRYPELMEWI